MTDDTATNSRLAIIEKRVKSHLFDVLLALKEQNQGSVGRFVRLLDLAWITTIRGREDRRPVAEPRSLKDPLSLSAVPLGRLTREQLLELRDIVLQIEEADREGRPYSERLVSQLQALSRAARQQEE